MAKKMFLAFIIIFIPLIIVKSDDFIGLITTGDKMDDSENRKFYLICAYVNLISISDIFKFNMDDCLEIKLGFVVKKVNVVSHLVQFSLNVALDRLH